MIRRNIELEARLIDDLLDLSRIAAADGCGWNSRSSTSTRHHSPR